MCVFCKVTITPARKRARPSRSRAAKGSTTSASRTAPLVNQEAAEPLTGPLQPIDPNVIQDSRPLNQNYQNEQPGAPPGPPPVPPSAPPPGQHETTVQQQFYSVAPVPPVSGQFPPPPTGTQSRPVVQVTPEADSQQILLLFSQHLEQLNSKIRGRDVELERAMRHMNLQFREIQSLRAENESLRAQLNERGGVERARDELIREVEVLREALVATETALSVEKMKTFNKTEALRTSLQCTMGMLLG